MKHARVDIRPFLGSWGRPGVPVEWINKIQIYRLLFLFVRSFPVYRWGRPQERSQQMMEAETVLKVFAFPQWGFFTSSSQHSVIQRALSWTDPLTVVNNARLDERGEDKERQHGQMKIRVNMKTIHKEINSTRNPEGEMILEEDILISHVFVLPQQCVRVCVWV